MSAHKCENCKCNIDGPDWKNLCDCCQQNLDDMEDEPYDEDGYCLSCLRKSNFLTNGMCVACYELNGGIQ